MDKFPRITLQIKDSIPQIIFEQSKDESKDLIISTENLQEIFQYIQDNLEFAGLEDKDIITELSKLSQKGDERFIEKLPDRTFKSDNFEIFNTVKAELQKAIEKIDDYTEYDDIDEKVSAELIRNQKLDILASILEMTYNIMIAKVIEFASDLGIGSVRLDDQVGLGRLQMKMAGELTKIDLELDIVD